MTQDQPRPKMRFDRRSEWPKVKALLDEAYGGSTESDRVERLRDQGENLFAIVAEEPGRPEDDPNFIGVVFFNEISVLSESQALQGAAIEPVAVTFAHRGKKVATNLIRAGLAQCRKRGLALALANYPTALFSRIGFEQRLASGLRGYWSGATMMALHLREDMQALRGDVETPDALSFSAAARLRQ